MSELRLDGKVAVVTGAGRGLGRAEALLLASQGAAVVVNDPGVTLSGEPSDESPADDVAREIEANGGRAVASRADCAHWDGAKSLVALAIDSFGDLDIVVNSAGILRERMFFNMTPEEWHDVLRVQLDGHVMTARYAAEHWRNRFKTDGRGGGRIVNTTSEAGLYGAAGQASYVAAKAASAALTIALARELAPYGATVNAISPRAKTRMTAGIADMPAEHGDSEELMALTMEPSDIAAIVGYLVSDEAQHISGQVFLAWAKRLELMETWHSVAKREIALPWSVATIEDTVAALLDGRPTVPLPLET